MVCKNLKRDYQQGTILTYRVPSETLRDGLGLSRTRKSPSKNKNLLLQIDFVDVIWMLLYVFVLCLSFTMIFPEDTDLSITSYSLFKFSRRRSLFIFV